MNFTCALTDDGTLFCQSRQASNNAVTFGMFMEKLESALRDHWEDYKGPSAKNCFYELREKLVIFMDNAKIHLSDFLRDWASKKGFMVITTPQ